MSAPRSGRFIFEVSRAAHLLRRPPRARHLVLPGLLVGGAVGLAGLHGPPAARLIDGLLLFSLPAALAAGTSRVLVPILGGSVTPGVPSSLAVVAMGWHGLVFLLARAVSAPWLDEQASVRLAFVLATGSLAWGRLVAHGALSHERPLRSLPPAVDQPALALGAGLLLGHVGPADLPLAAASTGAFLASAALFLHIADRPARTAVGYSGLRMLRHVARSILFGLDTAEVERHLLAASVPAELPVQVVLFRRVHGGLKAIFLVPWIHPGPYGQVGGSALPQKLEQGLADLGVPLLTFHGPSNHDQNLCASADVARLVSTVRELIGRARFSGCASPMVRCATTDYQVVAQVLGDGLLLAASSAPRPSDDIDPALALAAVEAGRRDGTAVTFIDAHNCFAEGEGDVHVGDPASYGLVDTTRRAADQARALTVREAGPRLGLAATRQLGQAHGVGPAGVVLALVEVGTQRSAFVLLDGNNLLAAAREAARAGALEVAQEAEVFTTDNHVLNVGGRSSFPAGLGLTPPEMRRLIADLARQAAADLEAVHAAIEAGRVPDVRVMGPGAAVRYATYIKASLAVMIPVAVACLLLGLLSSALLLLPGAAGEAR